MDDRSATEARRRRRAAIGSAIFMAVAPGTFAGALPWLLTRWKVRRPVPGGAATQAAGAALIGAGSVVLTHAFARFAREGIGTPAPIAPTEKLVVSGAYRHVRNPIYLALQAVIIGQALLLNQPRLLAYAAVSSLPPIVFVKLYEEPTLARTFGRQYEEYRRNVPGWVPRLRPWTPDRR